MVWHAIVVEYLIENPEVSIIISGLLSFSGIQQVFVTQTQAVLSAALPPRSLPSHSCENGRSVAVQRDAAVLPSFTCQFNRIHNSPIFDEYQTQSVFFHTCHENLLIKAIQTIPHNLHVSVKLTSLYFGLRLILVYPNPQ